ncbi:MAG: diacylglycerol kinase family lipid kinase [Verrucomicrobiae bacterium]|nr:diacylglycerol kinase family lipid kinase [Verrucomicrobiae bacterium]
MRACVIFNPAAGGNRARPFRQFLHTLPAPAELRPTTGPGSARLLARLALDAGFTTLVAAGGDGTVFEVLNGIADVPDGLARATLGILPLGTANILAHELRLPLHPARAWNLLQQGTPRPVDVGLAEFQDPGLQPARAHFLAVAGAGLDARAVLEVDPRLKRRLGKLAYVAAAWRAWRRHSDLVECPSWNPPARGPLLLAGNGRHYAGAIPVFEDGALDSGFLHARLVPAITPGLLLRALVAYLTRRWLPSPHLLAARIRHLELQAPRPTPLQLDGEWVGWLPATLHLLPAALRLLHPPSKQP